MKKLQNVSLAFAALLGFHYFFSYRWLYGLFKIHEIEHYDLIIFEDLIFPFGTLNAELFKWALMGLIWIISWHSVFSTKKAETIIRKNSGKEIKEMLEENKRVFLGILIISIIAFGLKFFFSDYDYSQLKKPFIWLYLILTFVIPFAYVILINHRGKILISFFVFSFLWVNIFIDTVLKDVQDKNKKNEKETQYVISYADKEFRTKKSDLLIYSGYKTWVFKNDSTKEINMIPTAEIRKVTIR